MSSNYVPHTITTENYRCSSTIVHTLSRAAIGSHTRRFLRTSLRLPARLSSERVVNLMLRDLRISAVAHVIYAELVVLLRNAEPGVARSSLVVGLMV